MITRRIAALIGFVALILIARPAAAHSELVQAEPAPGAQLVDSPLEIRLTFSEPVAPTSQIVLLTDDFQPVAGLVPQFNPAQPEQIYAPVPSLEPGVYTVQWAAASVDGHEVSGSYSFSVGLVTPGAPESPPPTLAGTPPAATRGFGVNGWLLAVIVLAVGLPLALLALRRGSRR